MDFSALLNKLPGWLRFVLVVLLVVFMLGLLIFFVQQLITIPEQERQDVVEQDFLSSISDLVIGPLDPSGRTSPITVPLEALGELSPYSGLVALSKSDSDDIFAADEDSGPEYLVLEASATNEAAVLISDWSLQSLVSGVWYSLPQGTEQFVLGDVHTPVNIALAPGERAIVAHGPSPVGISFRVNRCAGYLAHTQRFTPPLPRTRCNAPRELLPPTIENVQTYGDACVAFMESAPTCTYVTANTLGVETLSSECRAHIAPLLTYNYCVALHARDADFFAPGEWRLFLESNEPLWKGRYEVVRLLDEHNRTVDVISY